MSNKGLSAKVKEWEKDLESSKEMAKYYRWISREFGKALKFPKKSSIDKKDLARVLRYLQRQTNKPVSVQELREQLGYEAKAFNSIAARLKKLGEVFDPYSGQKNKGKFLRLI